MAVGLRVGSITDEIGTASFLHAFFSTVSAYCEPKGWGTGMPALVGQLYGGHLPASLAGAALTELREARRILAKHPPAAVVWDFEDRTLSPPWGNKIAESITNLSNYFVTSTGRDLFSVLDEALEEAAQSDNGADIVQGI